MINDSALALFVTLLVTPHINITTTHVICNKNNNDNDNYSIEDVKVD